MITVFPIETPSFVLRAFTLQDTEAIFRLDSDPEIQKYLGSPLVSRERSARMLEHEIATFARQGFGLVAVAEPVTDRVLGYASLHRDRSRDGLEVVVALAAEACGNRLGPAVAEALLDVGCRRLRATEIVARVSPTNTKALRLVERLRMKRVEQTPEEYIYAWPCSCPRNAAYQGDEAEARPTSELRSVSPALGRQ